MIEQLCSIAPAKREILFALGLVLWQSLETWLGKTEKVQAGSTPEALLNGLKWILALIKGILWKKPTI